VLVLLRFPLPDFYCCLCSFREIELKKWKKAMDFELNKKYWYHKESNEVSGEGGLVGVGGASWCFLVLLVACCCFLLFVASCCCLLLLLVVVACCCCLLLLLVVVFF
jgi:hypothetical protein